MAAISWEQIEKLGMAYRRKPSMTAALSLDKCLKKAEGIAGSLAKFFVRTHEMLAEANVSFCCSTDGVYPEWACQYDEESKTFVINPVGVLEFYQSCQDAQELLQTPEGRGNGNFSIYRLNAYKAELRKLTSQMQMFLTLFQEMARVMEVTHVERRRSTVKQEIEKSDLDYLNLIWAFRALEKAYLRLNGNNLRADLQFTWFESQWATGKA